jgi:glucokinase
MEADASMSDFRLGVDVGGTKIAVGLVEVSSGRVVHELRVPTTHASGRSLIDDIRRLADQVIAQGAADVDQITGVGLAIAELVSLDGRIESQQVVQLTNDDVDARLSGIASVVIVSDVQAAAQAEAAFGAGTHYDQFLYVSVGTGVSATLVLGGRPHRGAHGHAIILGATDDDAVVVEDIASGPALAREFARRTRHQQSAEQILRAAERGDPEARSVVNSAGAALGRAVGFAVNLVDPAAVVVGGGLGAAGGQYLTSMVRSARSSIWSPRAKAIPFLQAGLGESSALVGAACSADPPLGVVNSKGSTWP